MFPDYEPPEVLEKALSQAAIVAADIDPVYASVSIAAHAPAYVPKRLLDQAAKEIGQLYGLKNLTLTVTHPEDQLHEIEEDELRDYFVELNSMNRGSLAGARWLWDGTALTVKLLGNGKKELEECVSVVQNTLRERFAAPVTIQIEAGSVLEGQALYEAMNSMRAKMLQANPAPATAAKGEVCCCARSE